MNEKIYKTMGNAGIANIATGILVMVTGIATGIVMVVYGAKLINRKKNVMI